MKRLDVWIVTAALVALAAFAGCQSQTGSTGSTSGPDSTGDNANTDANANSPTENENSEPTDDLLSDEEAAAVLANVGFVEQFAAAFGTLAAADLPSLSGGPVPMADPPSTCPSLSAGADQLLLDFGTDGCTPELYPDVTYSGSLRIDVDVQHSAVVLVFDDLAVAVPDQGSVVVTGTAEGAVNQDNDAIVLGAALDLVFRSEGGALAVQGDLTFQADGDTGEMVIMTGEITTTDGEGQSNTLVLSQLHFDPAEYDTLVPDAGTANLRLGTSGPGSVSVVITFSEATPVEGTALVSVDGSPAETVSLAGLAGL
jgi:hypothetical protein